MVYARLILLTFLFISCRKLISVSPPLNEQPAEDVYNSDVQADAAVADLYYSLNSNTNSNLLSIINGMSADEGYSLFDSYDQFVTNSIPADDTQNDAIWRSLYQTVYRCNAVLEGLADNNRLTPAKIEQWRGEALFVRSLCYYYLTGCWGDVPLIMTTDVNKTVLAYRTAVEEVYDQMKGDLAIAMDLLPLAYNGTERVRANKWAATALMARISLQEGDHAAAEAYATNVINAAGYSLSPYDSTFLYTSQQAILQIWNSEGVTLAGQNFIPRNNISYFPLTSDMMAAFEPGDLRRKAWTGAFTYGGDTLYYAYKYKNQAAATTNIKEYLMVLRLAEQYLIRAEARAQQDNFSGAASDLNILRHNAGLPDLPAFPDRNSCMQAVIHERRVELFTESGDRWFTLKRAGIVSEVMRAFKPGTWQDWAVLYPIPVTDLVRNKNLTQNPGYQ
jgi:hypothetical protein